MFSNIGWGEIFVIAIIAVLVIGPERLPGVIQDVRAAIYAARKAINSAKAELNGEMSSLGQEFDALRGPINTAAEWGRMGPRAAITKALFDGDDSAWDDFDPRKPARHQEPGQPAAGTQPNQGGAQGYQGPGAAPAPQNPAQNSAQNPAQSPQNPQQRGENGGDYSSGGGFSWEDIT